MKAPDDNQSPATSKLLSVADRAKLESVFRAADNSILNSRDLLRSAKTVLDVEKLPNVSFGLSVLALEEIGKASLLKAQVAQMVAGKQLDPQVLRLDDHVKKLFWALWGPSFGIEPTTREQIESYRNLASQLHEKRLQSTYVEPDGMPPRNLVSEVEARSVLSLTEARLASEEGMSPTDLTEERCGRVVWFVRAVDDPEKRRFILGSESMAKLVELGSGEKWQDWLKEQLDAEEARVAALLAKEIARKPPTDEAEALKPKWKMRIQLYTYTHSVRDAELAEWNKHVTKIKLFRAGKGDQLVVEYNISRWVPVHAVYDLAWWELRKLVVALCNGSLGIFWWSLPKDTKRYYESLTDIESKNDVVLENAQHHRVDLQIGVLTKNMLMNSVKCFAAMPTTPGDKGQEPYGLYLQGMAYLCKSDIHLPLEVPAYGSFYAALKAALVHHGAWDGKANFKAALAAALGGLLDDKEEIEHHFDLGESLRTPGTAKWSISTDDVGKIKFMCDWYFLSKARARFAQESSEAGDT